MKRTRRGARVAEGARLESVCTFTGTEGSNPSLSAQLAPPSSRRYPARVRRGIGRWWLGPAQDGVANPARSGRKQRYRMSLCAAGHPSHHRRMPRRAADGCARDDLSGTRATAAAAALRGRRRAGARDAHAAGRDRGRTASRTRSSSPGRAASARPPRRASWPRRSTASAARTPSRATRARRAARSRTASPSTCSRSTAPRTPRSTRCAT